MIVNMNMKFIKRVMCACALCVAIISAPVFAEVEPDVEIHRVVGGLYSLAAAANLNKDLASAKPEAIKQQLAHQFENNNAVAQWLANVKIEKQGETIWVGVPVDKFSTARRFLRNSAGELHITDTPGGGAWFAGDYAWLAITSLNLRASRGASPDSNILFLSAGSNGDDVDAIKANFWWQNLPALTAKATDAVLKHWGVDAAGLHIPTGDGSEKFQASPVGLPEEFHTTSERDPFEMDVGDGNLTFNPIPRASSN